MVLDPQTPIGKIRLRIGDWADLPILPDSAIESALDDCLGNIPRAASLAAQYVLGTLTAKTHRKLANIEVWTNEQFSNYVQFIKLTILNPHNMSVAPVPYSGSSDVNPLVTFTTDWNAAYAVSGKLNHWSAEIAQSRANNLYIADITTLT